MDEKERDHWIKALQRELRDLRKLLDPGADVAMYHFLAEKTPGPIMVQFRVALIRARASSLYARSFTEPELRSLHEVRQIEKEIVTPLPVEISLGVTTL